MMRSLTINDTADSPLVSIIVRTKDRPKLLKKALRSIAAQTYRPIEVILVNDGGCDLDVEELKGILGDISLNYIRIEKNMGRSHAGNIGIDSAKGDYIGFLDDDDEFYPDHISTLASFLINEVNYSCTYSDSEIVEREYDDGGLIIREDNKGIFKSCDFSYEMLLFENYIPLMCVLLRKKYLSELGGFDTSLEMFEDWDLFIRASEEKPFYHIRKVTTKYIQWSKEYQIAFINWPNAEKYYLRVLSKHSGKITSEVAYRYFLIKQEEVVNTRNIMQDELNRITEELRGTHALIESLNTKNKESEYKHEEAEAANEELREAVKVVEAINKEFRDKLEETEAKNEVLRASIKEAETKNEELRDTLKGMQSLINELNSKNTHIEHKLSQMQVLQEELKDGQALVQVLQEELKDRQAQMQRLQEELKDRQALVQALLEEELKSRQAQVQGLQEELKDRQAQMQRLQEELKDGQALVQALLEEELKGRQAQVQGLQEELKDRQALVQALLEEELKDRQAQVQRLEEELKDRQAQVQRLRGENLSKAAYIEEVQSGVGWMVLEYYRRNIRDRWAPVGSKRRRAYDNFFTRIKNRKKKWLRTYSKGIKPHSSINHELFIVPKVNDNVVQGIDTKVSVIIPTKNAGTDFKNVLERIMTQKGIKNIEIIIVDSGSEDDTLALAKRYQARIISIHPSEFGHGRTRNYGAQFVSGEYIVFLSQDAIPIGDKCFLNMIQRMKHDPKIAAVSAKQIPRSDADLFACWQIWNHYEKFLRYSLDEVVSISRKIIDLLDPSDKRRVAQIDNIFSCIRRDIFKKFMFNELKYAEDLDLGLRLIKKGYKIGFLSSVGAIHSHNRNSLYYLKRNYIDRKALIHLLGIEPLNWQAVGIDSFPGMVQYVRSTYCKIDNVLQYLASGEGKQNYEATFFDSLPNLIHMCPSDNNGSEKDESLHSVIDELVSISGADGAKAFVYKDVMLQQFFSALESFKEYLSFYEAIDNKFEEIISALYKLCAVVIGANIGDYVAYTEAKNRESLVLKLDGIFGDGI